MITEKVIIDEAIFKPKEKIEELQSSEGELIGEECIEEQMTCYKCHGSKITKKGLQCKKCCGSGVFKMKGLGDIVKLVQDEVGNFCTSSFKDLFGEYLSRKGANQEAQKHGRVICDGCQMAPIAGVRYMCSVCNNYDLCANCEAQGIHSDHPMLKIRKPQQAPHSFVCQFKGDSVESKDTSTQEPKETKEVEKKLK